MLITELGYFALLAAFILAILQVVLPTIGVMRDVDKTKIIVIKACH